MRLFTCIPKLFDMLWNLQIAMSLFVSIKPKPTAMNKDWGLRTQNVAQQGRCRRPFALHTLLLPPGVKSVIGSPPHPLSIPIPIPSPIPNPIPNPAVPIAIAITWKSGRAEGVTRRRLTHSSQASARQTVGNCQWACSTWQHNITNPCRKQTLTMTCGRQTDGRSDGQTDGTVELGKWQKGQPQGERWEKTTTQIS